jgi:arylformamidase
LGSEAAANALIDPAAEREYNLRIRHPERDAVYRGFAARSAAYRDASPCRLDLRYAAGPRCTLDWFPAAGGAARPPLLVFIHGGYWRALDKGIFSFIAAPFNAAGVAVAMIGYDLAPAVTVTAIGAEVQAAHAWLAREAALDFDRERVVVSGHSAGGQLAALVAAAPPAGLGVIGAVPISGLFDLEPLRGASVNLDVRMSVEEARACSPMRLASVHARRWVVAVGSLETDGFQAQSRQFAAHAQALGATSELLTVAQRTHFDVLDDLADPAAPLHRSTVALFDAP